MILLEDLDTEFGYIKIIHSEQDDSIAYYQGSCLQSRSSTGGVSNCAYVHVMYNIIKQSDARTVLMLGGAGGTLATMLSKLGCVVTVVDINPHAFRLARKYFHMPENVECVVGDGWEFLRKTTARYDAIAVDVFDENENIPAAFTTKEFFNRVKGCLNPNGVIAMNILVGHDINMLADRIALTMESVNIPTALFDWPGLGYRNTVIAGGKIAQIKIDASEVPQVVREKVQSVARRAAYKWAAGGWGS